MNPEIAHMRGRLALAKQKFGELDILADGDIVMIRELVNPYEDDVTKIDVDAALARMKVLHGRITEMRRLKGQIDSLNEGLGG